MDLRYRIVGLNNSYRFVDPDGQFVFAVLIPFIPEIAAGAGELGAVVANVVGVTFVAGTGVYLADKAQNDNGDSNENQVKKEPRQKSATIRKKWERANGKSWPKDPETGKNQDVSHKIPLANGGTNVLSNIEPKIHKEHVQIHKDNGDYANWARRRNKIK